MTETESTPGAAILVAIDIAKDHHEVLVERLSPPTRRRRFRIANALAAGGVPAPARSARADRVRGDR